MSFTMRALRRGRTTLMHLSRQTGVLSRIADSRWRQQRLLILGYHGIAMEDEDSWDPQMYVSRRLFEQRLDLLARGGYTVLPLDEGLRRLRGSCLPPRSVAITFDDGMYNFYRQAYPLVSARDYPVTVFQTTYYCEVNKPIFNMALSYILWKTRTAKWVPPPGVGIEGEFDLKQEVWTAWIALIRMADREGLSGEQKDEVAARVAESLDVDYEAIKRTRLLQLMNPDEVREMAAHGVDFQLHTHRHRTPRDPALFDRELTDNLTRLVRLTGVRPVHFCYPNGDHARVFDAAFERHGIVSASTCIPGLASARTPPWLIPRFIDTTGVRPAVFDSWLSGAGQWLSRPRSERRD